MTRRLFAVVSAMSVALSVATVLLWARSFGRIDGATFTRDRNSYSIHSFSGRMTCARWKTTVSRGASTAAGRWEFHVMHANGRSLDFIGDVPTRLGFGHQVVSIYFAVNDGVPETTINCFVVPHAALVAAFLVLPALWGWRGYRHDRAGHCHECGYDLRASTGRCPECAAVIPGEAKA